MQESFFDLYLRYAGVGVSEPPTVYHRWVAISIVGTIIGRNIGLPFGHKQIYPNQYINLMGSPGSRKSTAINIGHSLIREAGFTRFAADRMSKEKFIMDMQQVDAGLEFEDLQNLCLDEPAECFIVAEEFTDFVGSGNIEFITMLTKLWDNLESYTQPKIHGQDVEVHQPTVNILCGNTAQNFIVAFPPEALGNGFMSRTLFIHGSTTGRKVAFPPAPDYLVRATLVGLLKDIKALRGTCQLTKGATDLLEQIYVNFKDLPDGRFQHYSTRRYTHLLKLCIIMAAMRLSLEITERDVLEANTILFWAECAMPKALGEYGRSKMAAQTTVVMNVLEQAKTPMNIHMIWKHVSKDFTRLPELADVIRNLEHAGKLQVLTIGKITGFVTKHEVIEQWEGKYILPDFLTEDEMILGN